MNGKQIAFHKTVRGHLHILRNIPCEDFSASFSDANEKYYIAVVADGHGDPACMRSAYGAQMAAEAAVDCLHTFAETFLTEGLPDSLSAPRGIRQTVQQLTNAIVSQWHQRIWRHLEEMPLTEEELEGAGKYANVYRAGERLAHVYGTTLIVALRLPEHLILIQQGDGRCDVFYADGTVDQPIPWDDRCFENVTTSMCDEDAASSIRHCVISLVERPVMACWLGSDGVEDSFRNMEGTHTFFRKLSTELVRRGADGFMEYLEETLPGLSQEGSGDDISVAGIADPEAAAPFLARFEALSRRYALSESKAFYEEKLCSMARKHSILEKRKEAAKADWSNKAAQLCGTGGPDPAALREAYRAALAVFRTAEQEFREYDGKYQEYLKKQKEIVLQIEDLEHFDKAGMEG